MSVRKLDKNDRTHSCFPSLSGFVMHTTMWDAQRNSSYTRWHCIGSSGWDIYIKQDHIIKKNSHGNKNRCNSIYWWQSRGSKMLFRRLTLQSIICFLLGLILSCPRTHNNKTIPQLRKKESFSILFCSKIQNIGQRNKLLYRNKCFLSHKHVRPRVACDIF